MAAEDNYGADAAPSEAQSDSTDTQDQTDQTDANEGSEQTALINKSVCPGMKVGDKINFTITGVYDDEYEVEYNDSDKDDNSGEKKSTMDESTDNLDRMAKEPSEM